MPVVPLLDGPQVQETVLPNATIGHQSSPDEYGAGLGQAIGTFGRQAQHLIDSRTREANQIYREEKSKSDQIAFNAARNQSGAWEADAMPRAFATRGQAAFGLPDTVLPEYDKTSESILKGLSNEEQKDAYRNYSDQKRNQIVESLNRHLGQERAAVDVEQYQAGLTRSQELVSVYSNDEVRVNEEIVNQLDAIDGIAARQGKTPEWVENAKLDATTNSHLIVIGKYIDTNDDAAARAWFDKYKGEINAPGEQSVTKTLEISGTRALTHDIVDGIPPETGLQEGIDAIKTKTEGNPKLREEAEQRWIRSHALRAQAQEQGKRKSYVTGLEALMDPGNLRGIDAVNPATLYAMGPENEIALRQYAENKATDKVTVTDPRVYAALTQMAARDPKAFSDPAVVLQQINNLSPADAKKFFDMQGEAARSGTSGPLMRGILTEQKVVSDLFGEVTGDSKRDPAVIDFEYKLNKTVLAEQAHTGKPLSPERIKELGKELMIMETIPATGWFGQKTEKEVRRFEVPGFDKMVKYPGEIPSDYRQKALGILVTKHNEDVEAMNLQAIGRHNGVGGKKSATYQLIDPANVPDSFIKSKQGRLVEMYNFDQKRATDAGSN